jgi:hypothetical protein
VQFNGLVAVFSGKEVLLKAGHDCGCAPDLFWAKRKIVGPLRIEPCPSRPETSTSDRALSVISFQMHESGTAVWSLGGELPWQGISWGFARLMFASNLSSVTSWE